MTLRSAQESSDLLSYAIPMVWNTVANTMQASLIAAAILWLQINGTVRIFTNGCRSGEGEQTK